MIYNVSKRLVRKFIRKIVRTYIRRYIKPIIWTSVLSIIVIPVATGLLTEITGPLMEQIPTFLERVIKAATFGLIEL